MIVSFGNKFKEQCVFFSCRSGVLQLILLSHRFIVMSSCLTFQDVLANDNITLDWFFRASFAKDIAVVRAITFSSFLPSLLFSSQIFTPLLASFFSLLFCSQQRFFSLFFPSFFSFLFPSLLLLLFLLFTSPLVFPFLLSFLPSLIIQVLFHSFFHSYILFYRECPYCMPVRFTHMAT